MGWRRVVLPTLTFALFLSSRSPAFAAARPDTIVWEGTDLLGEEDALEPKDKDAILELARRVGIGDPVRVTFGQYLPTLCCFVRVESEAILDGHKRTWHKTILRRSDWRDCQKVSLLSKRREGRWVGSRELTTTEESWRVVDADWFIDLSLGTGVPYVDAERIVRAIRHSALVNRLPTSIGPFQRNARMPSLDANELQSIEKEGAEQRKYRVRLGRAGGTWLDVLVLDDSVELHEYGSWLVEVHEPATTRLL